MPTRSLRPPVPVDLRRTLGLLAHGGGDPTARIRSDEAWRAGPTPGGSPATLRIRALRSGEIEAEAWGPGADAALEHLPELLGFHDRAEFAPTERPLRELALRNVGLRFGRTRTVLDSLVPWVLGQKITVVEAHRIWRRMAWALGEPAPGPDGMPIARVAPTAERLAATPYWDYHRLGLERRRADVIVAIARRADRLEEAAWMAPDEADRRLRAFRGVGPWTSALVRWVSLGDPDAVPVGDFHIPNTVAWNLAGEERADDARMLELLEPYAGQRGRVVRLLKGGGQRAPRYGPKMAPGRVDAL